MSKIQISPIRVIMSVESVNGPSNTEVISIVAVDRESNQCWDSTNRIFTLSEVEEWPRPQDDVFMTPIAPIEKTTIAADGTVITDTLRPIQKPIEHNQNHNDDVQTSQQVIKPIDSQLKFDELVHQRAMQLISEMQSAELANKQTMKSSDDIELDKFVKRFIDKSSMADCKAKKLVIKSNIDLDKLFIVVDALGFSKTDTFKSLIANDAITIVDIE